MESTRQQIVVALFVRQPIPGRVKTRLARDLGNKAACDLYRTMVADVIESIKTCGLPLYLFHDGQDAGLLPREWLDAAEDVISQQGDSLGERMTAAFEFLFSIGRERVILVGSDIPGIDAELLQSASAAIDRYDVVFSPVFDGGYCLVSSKHTSFNHSLFCNIPWSTDNVLGATLCRCKADGISYSLLDYRQDIDTLNDVEAYCRQPSQQATCTNSWLVFNGYMASPT